MLRLDGADAVGNGGGLLRQVRDAQRLQIGQRDDPVTVGRPVEGHDLDQVGQR